MTTRHVVCCVNFFIFYFAKLLKDVANSCRTTQTVSFKNLAALHSTCCRWTVASLTENHWQTVFFHCHALSLKFHHTVNFLKGKYQNTSKWSQFLNCMTQSLSNYWPITSPWVTWHKRVSPVSFYSQCHHQLILFSATCVINSQSRGVAVMWCGHVVFKKSRPWASLMNHVLNLPALKIAASTVSLWKDC